MAPGGTKWFVFFCDLPMNSADNNWTGNETFQYVIVHLFGPLLTTVQPSMEPVYDHEANPHH